MLFVLGIVCSERPTQWGLGNRRGFPHILITIRQFSIVFLFSCNLSPVFSISPNSLNSSRLTTIRISLLIKVNYTMITCGQSEETMLSNLAHPNVATLEQPCQFTMSINLSYTIQTVRYTLSFSFPRRLFRYKFHLVFSNFPQISVEKELLRPTQVGINSMPQHDSFLWDACAKETFVLRRRVLRLLQDKFLRGQDKAKNVTTFNLNLMAVNKQCIV